jgi:uncharacterized protein (DUF697 family)
MRREAAQPQAEEVVPMDATQKSLSLINWLADSAIKGLPPLTSAYSLAAEYENDPGYSDADARVDALIAWESAKNFGTGFVTGVGGILTLPFTVPTALAASWVLQARMVGAIALLYGHDLRSPETRTLLALAMVGGGFKEVLKQVGVNFTRRVLTEASSATLMAINRAAGGALLSRAARGGALNLSKAIPLVGGAISGGVDAYMCRAVGLAAREVFRTIPLQPHVEKSEACPVADADAAGAEAAPPSATPVPAE